MYQILKIGKNFIAGIHVRKPFLYFFTINKFEILGQEDTYELAIDLCVEHKRREWELFVQHLKKTHPEYILPSSIITNPTYTTKDTKALTTTLFSKN